MATEKSLIYPVDTSVKEGQTADTTFNQPHFYETIDWGLFRFAPEEVLIYYSKYEIVPCSTKVEKLSKTVSLSAN